MPFNTQYAYVFSPTGVLNAPTRSGVYGIYNSREWIHVGEAEDLQVRLLDHARQFSDQSRCIWSRQPGHFIYELVDAWQRLTREAQLIGELRPTCNQ